jgi:hypothetical protein
MIQLMGVPAEKLQQQPNQMEVAKGLIDEEARLVTEAFEGLAHDEDQQDEFQANVFNTIQLIRDRVNSPNINDSYLALYTIYKLSTAVDLI